MKPVSLSKTLTAGSTNCIALAQSLAGAGNVVINGGSAVAKPLGAFGATVTVAALDTQRRVAIASAGNDSGITAHIYGTRQGGQPINEVLALTNIGTAVSQLDYLNVTTIALSGASAGNVTIGTNGTGSTDWYVPNYNLTPFELHVSDELSGTVSWNFEVTRDPNFWAPPAAPGGATPIPNVQTIVSASTIAQDIDLTAPVTGWRFTINSGTGTLSAQGLQAGIANY